MDQPVMRRVIHTTRYDDGNPGDDEGSPQLLMISPTGQQVIDWKYENIIDFVLNEPGG
jgi:hypothetical protein